MQTRRVLSEFEVTRGCFGGHHPALSTIHRATVLKVKVSWCVGHIADNGGVYGGHSNTKGGWYALFGFPGGVLGANDVNRGVLHVAMSCVNSLGGGQ